MTYISDTQFYNPLVDGYEPPGRNNDLGKDDFLNLLVTQLRYQNPLEPMQDTEFIAQLAQFSQLEQLENMSGSLDTNSEVDYIMSQTIANTMATTLIGKGVVAEGSSFSLTPGENVDLGFHLNAEAATVTINILDENGSKVKTITQDDVTKGNHTISWDGRNSNDTPLAPGEYSYEVHASSQTGEEITASRRVIGVVDSVKYMDGKAYLIVGGYKLDLSSIIEVVDNGNSSTQPGT
ncbi:MAG: flagellar hook assembly protein FlgD [candidate division Zixibacteria bacterium]|nr:flagellar hook assembly protein FlgD [candidate division Zixibacteria bacterium]